MQNWKEDFAIASRRRPGRCDFCRKHGTERSNIGKFLLWKCRFQQFETTMAGVFRFELRTNPVWLNLGDSATHVLQVRSE